MVCFVRQLTPVGKDRKFMRFVEDIKSNMQEASDPAIRSLCFHCIYIRTLVLPRPRRQNSVMSLVCNDNVSRSVSTVSLRRQISSQTFFSGRIEVCYIPGLFSQSKLRCSVKFYYESRAFRKNLQMIDMAPSEDSTEKRSLNIVRRLSFVPTRITGVVVEFYCIEPGFLQIEQPLKL